MEPTISETPTLNSFESNGASEEAAEKSPRFTALERRWELSARLRRQSRRSYEGRYSISHFSWARASVYGSDRESFPEGSPAQCSKP